MLRTEGKRQWRLLFIGTAGEVATAMRHAVTARRTSDIAMGDLMLAAQVNALAQTLEAMPITTLVHVLLRGAIYADGTGAIEAACQLRPEGGACTVTAKY